jgi:hypothetical protein
MDDMGYIPCNSCDDGNIYDTGVRTTCSICKGTGQVFSNSHPDPVVKMEVEIHRETDKAYCVRKKYTKKWVWLPKQLVHIRSRWTQKKSLPEQLHYNKYKAAIEIPRHLYNEKFGKRKPHGKTSSTGKSQKKA